MHAFEEKTQKLVKRLLAWGKTNRRSFPWRETSNPYKVLVAEVMLHRTKAEQVVPVYNIFLKRYPTIGALSNAPIQDIKRILYPLGLHWRIRLLHEMINEISLKYQGKIPAEKEKLVALPGIGQYIASAVRCFSFGEPEALLDTNTVRVLGRFAGNTISDNSRRSKRFRQIYLSLINKRHSRDFNFAMIDLGALVCKPKNPLCEKCPFNRMCQYQTQQDARKDLKKPCFV